MSEAKKTDKIHGTLNVLADRFDGFQDVLDAEKTRKQEELEKKFDVIKRELTGIDHSLKLESKNTKNSLSAMKSWLEDRFVEFQKSVVDPMNEHFKKVNERCDKLQIHIDRLEKKQAEDRKTAKIHTDEAATALTNKLNDFKRKFDETVEGIDENKKEVQLKLLEQERSLVNQLKSEREAREKAEKQLSESLDAEEKVRAKGQKILTESIEKAREFLQSQVDDELKERQTGDEKCISAIAHYTAALQDAIKKLATSQ